MAQSLNNEIQNIVNSTKSYTAKRRELVKLGLRPFEINLRLPREARAASDVFRFTFGCEIEMNDLNRDAATSMASTRGLNFEYQGYNHHDSHHVFKFVTDSSIRIDNHGQHPIECVSPILEGGKKGLDALKTACEVLNANGATVNRSTGYHVHIGVRTMTDEWYVNVFKNYQMLEVLLDTALAPSRRGDSSSWCHTLRGRDFSRCHTPQDVLGVLNSRYFKVNPMAWGRHQTIEFRAHQGTTNFEKMKRWIMLLGKLVGYSKNHVLDHEITSFDDVPFLNVTEKRYFNGRANALAA